MVGQSIAHYEITEKLGQGGMGEVYRARDAKLSREVALKLLPEAFTSDSHRMGRFQREAELLASLNHPNIAAIYGIEEEGDRRALVMELVEGQDLSERIARGPLSLEESLRIALQVTEALEAAHGQGIVHRDLKPANVKLASDGRVKVLDFGLAKAVEDGKEASPDLTQSPTLSMAATQAGIILGTAAYMSPEQAAGEPVDHRADIWAFGVLLFEMLCGRQLFQGKTVSHTMAAVLHGEPDWNLLPADLPAAVRRLLRRCLAKEASGRLQAMGDARLEILDYLANPEAEGSLAAPPAGSRRGRWLLPAASLLTLLLGLAVGWGLKPAPQARPVQIEARIADDQSFFTSIASSVALSPDGRKLAYILGGAGLQGGRLLYLRALNQLGGAALSGTEVAYNPFFSPDGQWIGFVTQTELKKVSVSGGAPLTLCPVARNRGASWGSDGTIVFTPSPGSALMRVSAAGGEPEPVTTLNQEEGETSHRWPQFLPDGRHVLFTVYNSSDVNQGRIEVVDLKSGERRQIHRGGTYARYTASGHLLFVKDGTLFASPFDTGSLETTALPAPVLHGVMTNTEGGAQYDVSYDGTIAYLTGEAVGSEVLRTLQWLQPDGRLEPVTERRRDYLNVRLSPDERKLALLVLAGNNPDIWIHDLERNTQTRLTFSESRDVDPVWSPDGHWIYFASDRNGRFQLLRKPADGSGQAEVVQDASNNNQFPRDLSPDGKHLAFVETDATTPSIWMLPLDGSGEARVFLKTPYVEEHPRFSPDGRWIAYESVESGSWEVYVRPFPGPGGKWQISDEGGRWPVWSREGDRLLYWRAEDFFSVPVEVSGDSLRAGNPELFVRVEGNLQHPWDLLGGGRRLLIISNDQEAEATAGQNHLKFTFNWFTELEQLLATSR